MLNSLDIALLCDSRTVDASGDAITLDRSRHGIHAQLGDGTTPATMPTLDALNGRFTFDGGDYMVLPQASDVDGVLAGMGSIQDETYLVYFNPLEIGAADNFVEIFRKAVADPQIYIRFRGGAAGVNAYKFYAGFRDVGGGTEELSTALNAMVPYLGKQVILAYVRRASGSQELFLNAVSIATDTDAARDASNVSDCYIGSQQGAVQFLSAGTGVRFVGYSRTAWTQIQLSALQRFLRGNL